MPVSVDDSARLPPMIPHADVLERQRREELQNFRRYLVDAGVVKCLVKMYQHTAKHEMRMDNPNVVKDFLMEYVQASPEAEELEILFKDNEELRTANAQLEGQIEELTMKIESQQKLSVGQGIWQTLTAPDFWKDVDVKAGMSLLQVYQRLCGCEVDPATGQILVDLLRPAYISDDVTMSAEPFCDFVAALSPDLHAWCRDTLLPRLKNAALTPSGAPESPFEQEMVDAIRESGLYPQCMSQVSDFVNLNKGLAIFLEMLAKQFGRGGQ